MHFEYVEAYKSIRTNLKYITATNDARSFVITSTLPMEGKSNIALNLAVTLAEENKHVILIDGDLRKPMIHRSINYKNSGKGLSSYLIEGSLQKLIVHNEKLDIDILMSGAIPPNPTELLSGDRMRNLLQALKQHYDYVIVDAPPVSVVTDAAIIGSMVDGAILVVRSDYVPIEMVQLSKKKLEDVNIRILGVIVSQYNAKESGSHSGYYYYYSSYGYRYGYHYGNNKTNSASKKKKKR